MSVTTSLVKQLLDDQSNKMLGSGAGTANGDADVSRVSRSEIKAAAKEGTLEALAEYEHEGDAASDADLRIGRAETEATDRSTVETTSQSSRRGPSLTKTLLLALAVLYLARRRRRRRGGQSTST
jgi:MYXO-CTERM domain-containing protein